VGIMKQLKLSSVAKALAVVCVFACCICVFLRNAVAETNQLGEHIAAGNPLVVDDVEPMASTTPITLVNQDDDATSLGTDECGDEEGYFDDEYGDEDAIDRDISHAEIRILEDAEFTGGLSIPTYSVWLNGEELSDIFDYDEEFLNAERVGTATLVIKGKYDYFGEKRVKYNIIGMLQDYTTEIFTSKKVVKDEDGSRTEYRFDPQTYTGNAIVPEVTVGIYKHYFGYDNVPETKLTKLREGTDYTIKYKNNIKPGKATVTITGKGMYKGTVKASFNITYPLAKAKVSGIAKATYQGKPIKPRPVVKALGKTLKLNKDYTLSYKDNNHGGIASVIIKGKGYYSGTLKKSFSITAQISQTNVAKIPAQTLHSGPAKPNPVVTHGSMRLKLNKDYTLSYKNNGKSGKATVIITGKGHYKGKRTLTFTILPKGAGKTASQSEYDRIDTGMTLKQVVYIIGGKGKLMSSQTQEGATVTTYEWVGADVNKSSGIRSVTVVFQNGKVMYKTYSQFARLR
jgi:hypothetical protein